MKLLYIATNARCYAEDVPPGVRIVEEPDGMHPVQPDNIFKSDTRSISSWGPDDSLCVIFQGVTAPETYGEGISKAFIEQEMVDDLMLKFHQQKQPISRVFWRRLVGNLTTGAMLFLACGIIGITALLAYAIVRVVVG